MSTQTKRDVVYLILALLLAGYGIWYYARLEYGEGRVIQFTILALLIVGGFLHRIIKKR